ncbi:MAG: dTMP kinase [Actinobacteria bacterium]|uniref:dTMP kinase n=1 Tax=freshwater metagenome TaxID=449393 RepID=A0A6J6JH18_9ZZZZ|nr:dTMP kinase [Ilumatobacteraceae bacterium]MSZ18669.1 dTMP kinase [Actinomycetota bacterium]
MATPLYIALEGLEGCGKSTHTKRLGEHLDAVITREPGGTRIGTLLRAILADPENSDLDRRTEALLMAADRAQHMAEVIKPSLAQGRHVVSDRSIYSTLAYQGYGRQLGTEALLSISTWALQDRLPDLVIYIDVPTDVLNARLAKRDLDRFEREGADFFARIAEGFRELRAADPERWIIIDGTVPKDDVEAAIRTQVNDRLNK